MDAVIDAIKPGKTTADAARILLPALARGYRSEAEALTMEVGHGIGMHHYCPPLIHAEWSLKHPQVFEPGMALALEVDEGEPRACGVRVENMIIITKEGPEIIDHIPRDCIMEPPASNRWA
jgi:Xaa-Pro aminopeptidase